MGGDRREAPLPAWTCICENVLGKVVKTNEGWELPGGAAVLRQERLLVLRGQGTSPSFILRGAAAPEEKEGGREGLTESARLLSFFSNFYLF